MPGIIITHTQNATGQCRIYLGGIGGLECWIDPDADKIAWSFHVEAAVAGNQLTEADIAGQLEAAKVTNMTFTDLGRRKVSIGMSMSGYSAAFKAAMSQQGAK